VERAVRLAGPALIKERGDEQEEPQTSEQLGESLSWVPRTSEQRLLSRGVHIVWDPPSLSPFLPLSLPPSLFFFF
jgi:hypothetical protein